MSYDVTALASFLGTLSIYVDFRHLFRVHNINGVNITFLSTYVAGRGRRLVGLEDVQSSMPVVFMMPVSVLLKLRNYSCQTHRQLRETTD